MQLQNHIVFSFRGPRKINNPNGHPCGLHVANCNHSVKTAGALRRSSIIRSFISFSFCKRSRCAVKGSISDCVLAFKIWNAKPNHENNISKVKAIPLQNSMCTSALCTALKYSCLLQFNYMYMRVIASLPFYKTNPQTSNKGWHCADS